MRAQDAAGRPLSGIQTRIWFDNTSYPDFTGQNGEFVRAGISQWFINWHVCIAPNKPCVDTNATDTGQRVNIVFTRKPCGS